MRRLTMVTVSLVKIVLEKIVFGIRVLLIRVMVILSAVIPKNKRLWIFGSRSGLRYDDNSKYLFEYVNKVASDIRAIWLTESQTVYEYVKKMGYEVYKTYSLKGYFYTIFAGAAIISVCWKDINIQALRKSTVIQLWHGTPLKTTDVFGSGEKYDMVILAAEEFLHNQLLGDTRQSRFFLTGYPRNDTLLSSQKIESVERLKAKYQYDKMVLYLPAYRDQVLPDGNTNPIEEFDLFESFGFDFDQLESLMKQNHSLFVLKLHPVQDFRNRALVERIHKSNHLHLVDPEDPLQDVYEYLKYADVLVTDYSSVYFDFLLVNRPIIFAPFDFDSCVARRPLGFPYEEVTPGPKAKNWVEVCTLLQEILSGRDDWAELRQSVNRRFNVYRDGGSSERVYREIRSLLGLDHHE